VKSRQHWSYFGHGNCLEHWVSDHCFGCRKQTQPDNNEGDNENVMKLPSGLNFILSDACKSLRAFTFGLDVSRASNWNIAQAPTLVERQCIRTLHLPRERPENALGTPWERSVCARYAPPIRTKGGTPYISVGYLV
jgi:hypothetical protein